MFRSVFACAVLSALVFFSVRDAVGEPYPSKPIKLVVAVAPGGPNDVIARAFADVLSDIVKQPVIVENYAGAGGTIGATIVAKTTPDGYTLLVGGAFNLALAPSRHASLAYDPLKDFTALGAIARVPYALAVRSDVPARTLPELIAYARARPGVLSYGSSGVGSNSSLAVELLKSMAEIDILHVPYKGSAPAVTATLGGQIDMVCVDLALLAPHARTGKLRLVASTGVRRAAMAPDLPTAAEQGLPDLVLEPWFGLVAPAGIPVEARETLAAALAQAVRMPVLRERLQQRGYEVIIDTPDSFGALIRSDIGKYARLVEKIGIPREQ
jgi:tripartite-type tricarboxylate transporter receptor subunit TctC